MALTGELADGWSLVMAGGGSDALSEPRDCCAYGLNTDEGLILFDAGAGVASPLLALAKAGFAEGPSLLCLTHAHADHSGGAAIIKNAHGCDVVAGRQTADWLENADEQAISLDVAKRAGVYPADYVFAGCGVDRRVGDEDSFEFGGAAIKAIATPGHSADHLSYLVTYRGVTTLVAGDAIFSNGTVILQDTWDSSVSQTCATIRRLGRYEFAQLLPGHGAPLLNNAREAVDIARRRVDQLLPPQNFI